MAHHWTHVEKIKPQKQPAEMTSKEKIICQLAMLDPSILDEENLLRNKTLITGGRRFIFNDEGDLVKIQDLSGLDSRGKNIYVTIGKA